MITSDRNRLHAAGLSLLLLPVFLILSLGLVWNMPPTYPVPPFTFDAWNDSQDGMEAVYIAAPNAACAVSLNEDMVITINFCP